MNLITKGLALSCILAVLSCYSSFPRRAVFVPAQYEPFLGQGNASIKGRAFYSQRPSPFGRDKTLYANENDVILKPVTEYSTEWFKRTVVYNKKLEPAIEHEWIEATTKEAKTDKDGFFEFKELRPGDYYVAVLMTWQVEEPTSDYSGTAVYDFSVYMGEKVEVAANEEVSIDIDMRQNWYDVLGEPLSREMKTFSHWKVQD